MRSLCKIEIWKAFHNKGFYIALGVGILLCMLDTAQNIGLVKEYFWNSSVITLSNGVVWRTANPDDTSVFYNWMGVTTLKLSNIIFYFIFPILAAMPYGWAGLMERKNGYCNHIWIRSDKKKELIGKYIAAFLSAGCAIAAPIILSFLMSAMVMPMNNPRVTNNISTIHQPQFGSLLFYRHPLLFVLADIGLIFLWGGILGGMSLAVGMLVKNKVAAVVVPFCVCLLIEMGYELNIWATDTECSPFRLFHMVTIRGTRGTIIFGEIILLFILSFAILGLKGFKDEGL